MTNDASTSYSISYPTPQTVLINFGFFAGSLNFSLNRPTCAITVLLLFRYFSFHTASNNSSEGTTFPWCSHKYHKIENSIGVSESSFPYKENLCSVNHQPSDIILIFFLFSISHQIVFLITSQMRFYSCNNL